MASTLTSSFGTVAEIGDLGRLFLQNPSSDTISLELPVSERAAFEEAVDDYKRHLVARTDKDALLTLLKRLAEKYYRLQPDGSFALAEDNAEVLTFDTFKEAFEKTLATTLAGSPNMTVMNASVMAPDEAAMAITRASDYLHNQGYQDFSFVGCGTFALSFQARHAATGRVHIIKLTGWDMDECVIKGRSVPDNLRPVFENPEGMPHGWNLYGFPKVLPLDKIASEIGTGKRIEVRFTGLPDDKVEGKAYLIPGNIDLITEMFVNSMSENCFALDEPKPAIGLMPLGHLTVFDMGMIDHRSLKTDSGAQANGRFSVKREQERMDLYGSLGAPFLHTDLQGVPLSVVFFQPELRDGFRPAPKIGRTDGEPLGLAV